MEYKLSTNMQPFDLDPYVGHSRSTADLTVGNYGTRIPRVTVTRTPASPTFNCESPADNENSYRLQG